MNHFKYQDPVMNQISIQKRMSTPIGSTHDVFTFTIKINYINVDKHTSPMDPMGKGFVAVAHLRKTQGGPLPVISTATLQGTNISPKNGILKMIFLFPRWDMLIPWRVLTALVMVTTPVSHLLPAINYRDSHSTYHRFLAHLA